MIFFPFLFLEAGFEGDGEVFEFFDGTPGDAVGAEFEAEDLGEGGEHTEAVEPGKATVDERDHLWLAFACDLDVDDATQLSAVSDDDFAANQVLNPYDGATGVR